MASRPPVNPEKVTLRSAWSNGRTRPGLWEIFSPRRIPSLHGIQVKSGPNTGMYRYRFYHHSTALQVVLRYTDDKRKS